MKALFPTAALLVSLFLASPMAAHAQAQPTATPAATRPAVRPLTRYLTAMLHLTPKQAATVQKALRTHTAHSLASEELTASLSPVLSLDAQQRLQSLQGDVATYRTLYYLAARH